MIIHACSQTKAAEVPGGQSRIFYGREGNDHLLNFLTTESHKGSASSLALARSLVTGAPSYPDSNSSLTQELSYDPRGVVGSKHDPIASTLSISSVALAPPLEKNQKNKKKPFVLPDKETFGKREEKSHNHTHLHSR